MTEFDPEYVAARTVLLDVLGALRDHLDAIILVGAQAVYLRTVPLPGYAPHTTDADLAIDPSALEPGPGLEAVMRDAGFRLKDEDTGLEGALVEQSRIEIGALDEADPRRIVINVAGPAALLVAKLHKIDDRSKQPDRLTDKDAGDVLRLFMSTAPGRTAQGLCLLLDDARSAEVTRVAIDLLDSLFGTPRSLGTRMAVRALTGVLDPATVEATCITFVDRVLVALEPEGRR